MKGLRFKTAYTQGLGLFPFWLYRVAGEAFGFPSGSKTNDSGFRKSWGARFRQEPKSAAIKRKK